MTPAPGFERRPAHAAVDCRASSGSRRADVSAAGVIPTAPLRARDRLAALIVSALSDAAAREALDRLAAAGVLPGDWLDAPDAGHAALVLERARRAARMLADRPLVRAERSVADTLDAAADLFDAGLAFETHEILEPAWQAASGRLRETLQGLIQVAVGYQHLANGNGAGGRTLLIEGSQRLRAGRLEGLDVDAVLAAIDAALLVPPAPKDPPPQFPRRAPGWRHEA